MYTTVIQNTLMHAAPTIFARNLRASSIDIDQSNFNNDPSRFTGDVTAYSAMTSGLLVDMSKIRCINICQDQTSKFVSSPGTPSPT